MVQRWSTYGPGLSRIRPTSAFRAVVISIHDFTLNSSEELPEKPET